VAAFIFGLKKTSEGIVEDKRRITSKLFKRGIKRSIEMMKFI